MNDDSNGLPKNSNYDLEKNSVENEEDSEEYFAKIFEKNMDRITNITLLIKISQLGGIISFLIFMVMLAIRVSNGITFSWFYLLIPSLLCLSNFTVLLNLYLLLKDIFDEAEKKLDDEDSSQIGSILTYFCLNISAVCIFIYLMLFFLKIEEILISQWNIISIPLYLTFGICLFYWIFIFPAFLQNKLFFEISLIFLYIISGFIFFVLLNFKLDESNTSGIFTVFIPLLFSLGLHSIYLLFQMFVSGKNDICSKISSFGFVFSILLALILLCFKAEGLTPIQNWIPVLLFLIGYLGFVSDKILAIICGEREDDAQE